MANSPDSHLYSVFDTLIGPCGLTWRGHAVVRMQLPEKTLAATKLRLRDKLAGCREVALDEAPAWLRDAAARIQRHLRTGREDLSRIPIDVSACPDFHRQVYEAAMAIPAGKTATYGEVATMVGSPGAARAVGQALGRNPVALIVPCHRVVAAGGKSGGFSAFGGVDTKHRILAIESASSWLEDGDFAGAARRASERLRRSDPILGDVIARIGPCALQPRLGDSVFAALARAIVYQQLSGKAAATILARFVAAFPGSDFPAPADVLRAPDDVLRGVGLSGGKAAALRDLAAKVLSGELPDMRRLAGMDDDAVVEALTNVRGIGRWTAEMLLIFDLGRLDVLPVADLGIRKGFAQIYGKRALPEADELTAYAERWRPFRSIASWYLWRALDPVAP